MFLNILFGILGIITLLVLMFLLSDNKKKINYRTVLWGLGLQFSLGVIVLYWTPGRNFIDYVGTLVTKFLGFAADGSVFLFGNLAKPEFFPQFGFQFAFLVLPTIIFFSAFMSICYHYNVMQKVVEVMAKIMTKTMKTSGSESLSCASNVFLGQTEAPLLVKPFLLKMTNSELAAVMVGGFGTIAGGVMAGYIQMGVNAAHIITASVMAAPASLMIAKILFPETEKSETGGNVKVPYQKIASNGIDAACRGAGDGLMLALNVGAMLIAFIALIAVVNAVLGKCDYWVDSLLFHGEQLKNGEFAGYFPGSLKTIFSFLLWPLAFIIGVPTVDCGEFANLVGTKISLNEFVAYSQLSELIKANALGPKATMMATFALCGFANFSSIAIQIGGIGALAPERRSDLARLGFKCMLGGATVSLLTATIAGMVAVF